MTQSDLQPCNEPGPIKNFETDNIPPFCRDEPGNCDEHNDSVKDVASRDTSWFEEFTFKKTGIGQSANCDPMLQGHIVNQQDGKTPNRNVVYRYAQSMRGTDEGVKDLFSDIVVQDESSKIHNVPIIWGTQEKAVITILGENYRKDTSTVVDNVKLPMLSIHSNNYEVDMKRYTYHKAVDYIRQYKQNWKPGFTVKENYERDTVFGVTRGVPVNISYSLYGWTMYQTDMNQIIEQILPKITPMGYIRVRGIGCEIPVKIDSITSNVDVEPGDRSVPVFKFQVDMTAESYILQPIVRNKAVLKTQIELVDSVNEEEISEVVDRLEQTVELL